MILRERTVHRVTEIKWYSAVTLAVLTILTAFLITPLKTNAQEPPPFYWGFINVDISVQDNGDMLVTETQKYVFTAAHTNERYRWIPLDKVAAIESVEVLEEGQVLSATTGIENNQFWIKWQHELNPPESRTFLLKYRVVGGLHIHEDGDQVLWKALFKERDAPIQGGNVTVRLPESLAGQIIEINSFGAPSDAQTVDSQTVKFTVLEPLPPGEELEVQVKFNHGVINTPIPQWQQQPDEPASSSPMVGFWRLWFIVPIILVSLSIMSFVGRITRNRYIKEHGLPPTRYDVPTWIWPCIILAGGSTGGGGGFFGGGSIGGAGGGGGGGGGG
jgi:hypothetical protein